MAMVLIERSLSNSDSSLAQKRNPKREPAERALEPPAVQMPPKSMLPAAFITGNRVAVAKLPAPMTPTHTTGDPFTESAGAPNNSTRRASEGSLGYVMT